MTRKANHGASGRDCARVLPTLLGVTRGAVFTCTCGRVYVARRGRFGRAYVAMRWVCVEAPGGRR